jgi:hypothetical protein
VNAPATPKPNPLHTRLAQIGEYAKALETKADRRLEGAREFLGIVRIGSDARLEWAAYACWAHIYTRRAKVARRDEKRLGRVVAWADEQDRRASVRREKATA